MDVSTKIVRKMKCKAGDIVKISGVYKEVTLEGKVLAELILIKNEIFPATSQQDSYYKIKVTADGSEVDEEE